MSTVISWWQAADGPRWPVLELTAPGKPPHREALADRSSMILTGWQNSLLPDVQIGWGAKEERPNTLTSARLWAKWPKMRQRDEKTSLRNSFQTRVCKGEGEQVANSQDNKDRRQSDSKDMQWREKRREARKSPWNLDPDRHRRPGSRNHLPVKNSTFFGLKKNCYMLVNFIPEIVQACTSSKKKQKKKKDFLERLVRWNWANLL